MGELNEIWAEIAVIQENIKEINKKLTWMYDNLSDKGYLPKKVKVDVGLQEKINKLKNKEIGIYDKEISAGVEKEQASECSIQDTVLDLIN